jgi:hypothetical protein
VPSIGAGGFVGGGGGAICWSSKSWININESKCEKYIELVTSVMNSNETHIIC